MRTFLLAIIAANLWAQQPAAALPPNFVRDVLPALTKADCAGCHNQNGVASTTRLVFPEKGASNNELEAFGDTLRSLVNTRDPAASPLLAKPTMRLKHAGGPRIKPNSREEAIVRRWADHLAATAPMARRTFVRSGSRKNVLRRLTHAQYDNTVADLLGDRTRPSRQFPPEDFIDGFKNQYEAQSISPILADNYAAAAEKLAGAWEGKDPGPQFVKEFGKRAFRRPLTAEEETRYGALYKQGQAKLVIEAMVQSPAFLFRPETAPAPELWSYTRAARLSYLLWDTMPDAALMATAERGELNTPAGLEATVRRMLADARARRSTDEFIAEWFRFDTIVTMVKERRAFPLFTRELALAMTEETRRLAADLIWMPGRSFMDFYTANYTFLNADLAALYKLPVPAEEFSKVMFPDTVDRGGGVLGHGAFLALTAKPADTSITARGLFVREHILCQQVPQPPPGVNTNLPAAEAKALTNRDKLQLHLANPACASCHNLIDPIGHGLEKFDGIGVHREKAKVDLPKYNRREETQTVEADIDNSGWVAGIPNSEFRSPKELGRILAATPQCQECVVKQYFRYAMGRHEMPSDRPVIERAATRFRDSGFQFLEMVIELVKATEFGSQTAL